MDPTEPRQIQIISNILGHFLDLKQKTKGTTELKPMIASVTQNTCDMILYVSVTDAHRCNILHGNVKSWSLKDLSLSLFKCVKSIPIYILNQYTDSK